jgi:NADH-quinone oxidoreductase subunit H
VAFWIETVAKVAVVVGFLLTAFAYLTWVERKVSGFIQARIGPNRVGPAGLLQPVADGIKQLFKEDVVPRYAYRPLFLLAPALALVPAVTVFAVIPFGDRVTIFGHEVSLQIANPNVGILFVLAFASLEVYGVAFAGWASNNKWSLMGGLRSAAQMISYELAMGLAIVGILMVAGSLRLNEIVFQQDGFLGWNLFIQPIGFVIFLIAGFAEANRLPFDLPEAETELVGGYHTEYSSMKFAMFPMSEYLHMIAVSGLVVILYLGGWQVPGVYRFGWPALTVSLIELGAMAIKVGFFLFLFIWVRWTLPRFRYDQLMTLGWKVLLPLSIVNIFWTGIGILMGWF